MDSALIVLVRLQGSNVLVDHGRRCCLVCAFVSSRQQKRPPIEAATVELFLWGTAQDYVLLKYVPAFEHGNVTAGLRAIITQD
jgi:hypothetical protein